MIKTVSSIFLKVNILKTAIIPVDYWYIDISYGDGSIHPEDATPLQWYLMSVMTPQITGLFG